MNCVVPVTLKVSACPDLTQLVWGAPDLHPDGGTCNAVASGNLATLTASHFNSGLFDYPVIGEFVGEKLYAGPSGACNYKAVCRLSWTGDLTGPGGENNGGFIIDLNSGGFPFVVQLNWSTHLTGNWVWSLLGVPQPTVPVVNGADQEIPFSIPAAASTLFDIKANGLWMQHQPALGQAASATVTVRLEPA